MDCGANVIETNICAAEVLKHQSPQAQGAIILRGLSQTYANAKALPCWGFPSGV